MNTGFPTPHSRTQYFIAAALALGAALGFAACSARAEATAPIKLAVFEFELEDYSAAATVTGESPADMDKLRQITADARRLIEKSGRYALVDVSAADAEAVKQHSLRNCHGCEARAARKLGAEQSFLGIIARISRTEYTVRFQIREVRSGDVILDRNTDLRMGADYSWGRGVAWLINNRLLEPRDQP